jgi:two-component system sensor histidine kinase CpxA
VNHLSGLVNELLAFSRAEMKSDTVQLERMALLPAVETAVRREAGPNVEIDVRIDPRIRVVAAPELLIRALANLVRNAVKYAGAAGPIEIVARNREDAVEMEVRDTGPGVSDDLVDQLFEPFFRPETARDRDSGGVGLGLAIVRTCIETCNGRVSAANRKPAGFVVRISLTR